MREGGGGRYPTPKNVGPLIPAAKSRFWRQNLKVVAKKNTNIPPKTKSNGAAPTHTRRSEVLQKIGRGNAVAEIHKAQNLGVPWMAYWLYLYSGKATLAVMYPVEAVKFYVHPVPAVLLNHPCCVAAFVLNTETHFGARPLVRSCVGPELACCVLKKR